LNPNEILITGDRHNPSGGGSPPNPTPGFTFIKSDDLPSFEGIKNLNKELGLTWEPVNADEINKVNAERMKNLKSFE
jgi:hypothetical protein